MIRLLCKHYGWRVDMERRLLIHTATGCVYTNPSKDVLRAIVTAGFEPYVDGAHDNPLVQLAVNERGAVLDNKKAGQARTRIDARRRKSPIIFVWLGGGRSVGSIVRNRRSTCYCAAPSPSERDSSLEWFHSLAL